MKVLKHFLLGGAIGVTFVALYSGYQSTIYRAPSTNFPDECSLHQVPMKSERRKSQRQVVSIDYHFGYPQAYAKVKPSKFPYSGRGLWDQQDPPAKWIRWIESKHCPECRAEESRWTDEWEEQNLGQGNRSGCCEKRPGKNDA